MAGLIETGRWAADTLAGSYPCSRHSSPQWERPVSGLEIFFDGLLALMAVLITWFAIFSVMKLYQGQR